MIEAEHRAFPLLYWQRNMQGGQHPVVVKLDERLVYAVGMDRWIQRAFENRTTKLCYLVFLPLTDTSRCWTEIDSVAIIPPGHPLREFHSLYLRRVVHPAMGRRHNHNWLTKNEFADLIRDFDAERRRDHRRLRRWNPDWYDRWVPKIEATRANIFLFL